MISPEVFPGFDLLYRSLLNCVHVRMIIPVHHLPQKKHANLSSQLPCCVKTLLECILHIGESGKRNKITSLLFEMTIISAGSYLCDFNLKLQYNSKEGM